MPFHNPKLENGETLDAVALKLCAEVCDSLKDLMVGRTEFPPPPEAYTVFCLTDLARREGRERAGSPGTGARWRDCSRKRRRKS